MKKNEKDRDTSIVKSNNHEMYLHKIKKATLSIFDDKRCNLNELKVNLGINHHCYFMNRCKSKRKI